MGASARVGGARVLRLRLFVPGALNTEGRKDCVCAYAERILPSRDRAPHLATGSVCGDDFRIANIPGRSRELKEVLTVGRVSQSIIMGTLPPHTSSTIYDVGII
jgi:hypothetical protein